MADRPLRTIWVDGSLVRVDLVDRQRAEGVHVRIALFIGGVERLSMTEEEAVLLGDLISDGARASRCGRSIANGRGGHYFVNNVCRDCGAKDD